MRVSEAFLKIDLDGCENGLVTEQNWRVFLTGRLFHRLAEVTFQSENKRIHIFTREPEPAVRQELCWVNWLLQFLF